ncbi:hypothetical protein MMC31_008045, partial [Peltigera leucophlebia]|nr:hypothetical protein [Peltigera leucophlebia]
MAVGDITSYITNFVLPVVSLWDVLTSAVEVNRVLASLDETLGEDKLYKIMTKMTAYADKRQQETILSFPTEMHKDKGSYEACGKLGNILNHMASNYIVLLSSCMDKAPNPRINWHIAAFVRHERHYYIFSDRFDPSLYPTPNLNKPRIRDQDGLILIYHLLSVLGLKKTESYHPVKAASK